MVYCPSDALSRPSNAAVLRRESLSLGQQTCAPLPSPPSLPPPACWRRVLRATMDVCAHANFLSSVSIFPLRPFSGLISSLLSGVPPPKTCSRLSDVHVAFEGRKQPQGSRGVWFWDRDVWMGRRTEPVFVSSLKLPDAFMPAFLKSRHMVYICNIHSVRMRASCGPRTQRTDELFPHFFAKMQEIQLQKCWSFSESLLNHTLGIVTCFSFSPFRCIRLQLNPPPPPPRRGSRAPRL